MARPVCISMSSAPRDSGRAVATSRHMKFLAIAYIAVGILVHVALWLLCRKTGVDRRGMFYMWLGLLTADWWGIFIVPLLWPIVAAFSLFWWAADYWHL